MCDAPINRAQSLSADIRPKHVISDRLKNLKFADYRSATCDSKAIAHKMQCDFQCTLISN